LRIIFALTIALGVFAPTLTSSTTNAVSIRTDDVTPDLRAMQPQQISKPLGDIAIETSDRDAVDANETRVAKLDPAAAKVEEPPAAVKVEEPAAAVKLEEPAAAVKLDEPPAAVKIEEPAAVVKLEEPAAVKVEEPVAARDEDDRPVTVPIEQVCEALVDAAVAHSLPIGFFARLIWQESRFDQWARSPVGAMGVAQFMPPTAAEYGLRNPFDPIKSVAASARFLRELREQFGNLGLAAAAYNAGGGRIRKWLNGQSAMPEETRNYVNAITGHPPKRWTVRKPLEVSVALPQRAPCDGVDGLSRDADPARHEVQLTGLAVELIEQAETARQTKLAAARAARKKRFAAAKTKGRKAIVSKVAAKAKGKVRVAAASAR
jgi:hypothetical protein